MKAVAPVSWFLANCLLALAWQRPAYAWGDEGHRITGHIASTLLNDATRQQLRTLIGTDDLAQIATWMDDERESLSQRLPGSAKWHYENRPACAAPKGASTCPKGQCITEQIERSARTLKNSGATIAQRADAIRVFVHLLGDLHQPLHLIDNHDRGGNDLLVRLPREKEPRRLHAAWDTQFVRMNIRRTNEDGYARSLTTRFDSQRVAWQSGTIEQWAKETHALALQNVYAPLPGFSCRQDAKQEVTLLPAAYVDTAKLVVDAQLTKAGVRMALLLNEHLGGSGMVIAR